MKILNLFPVNEAFYLAYSLEMLVGYNSDFVACLHFVESFARNLLWFFKPCWYVIITESIAQNE